MTINRHRVYILMLMLAALLVASCGSGPTTTAGSGTEVRVSFASSAAASSASIQSATIQSAAVPSYIVLVRITITGPGMEPIVVDIPVLPGQASVTATIVVPTGPGRTFLVQGFDASGNVIFDGTSMIDLAGSTIDITVPVVRTATPSNPTALAALPVSATEVSVEWGAATDDVAVTGYTIYRDGAPLTTTAGLQYSDQRLAPETTYCYKAAAFDAEGNLSGQSNESCATTLPDTTPPTAPTPVRAVQQGGAGSVTVNWGASTDNVGVTGYEIYRDGQSLGTLGGNVLTYGDTVPIRETPYCYWLVAFDAATNRSEESAHACVQLSDTTAPTAPGNVTVQGLTMLSIQVSWTAGTDNIGVVGYDIFRHGQFMGSTTDLSYIDENGMAPGIVYCYTIVARDAAGNVSPPTTQSCGAALGDIEPPSVPENVTLGPGSYWDLIDVTWSASSDNVGVAGYNVYMSATGFGPQKSGQVSGQAPAPNSTPLSLLASTEQTVYTYQITSYLYDYYCFAVSAFDTSGNESAQSAPACDFFYVGKPQP